MVFLFVIIDLIVLFKLIIIVLFVFVFFLEFIEKIILLNGLNVLVKVFIELFLILIRIVFIFCDFNVLSWSDCLILVVNGIFFFVNCCISNELILLLVFIIKIFIYNIFLFIIFYVILFYEICKICYNYKN